MYGCMTEGKLESVCAGSVCGLGLTLAVFCVSPCWCWWYVVCSWNAVVRCVFLECRLCRTGRLSLSSTSLNSSLSRHFPFSCSSRWGFVTFFTFACLLRTFCYQ